MLLLKTLKILREAQIKRKNILENMLELSETKDNLHIFLGEIISARMYFDIWNIYSQLNMYLLIYYSIGYLH